MKLSCRPVKNFRAVPMLRLGNFRTITRRSFCTANVADDKPREIFRLVANKEIDTALEFCKPFAAAVKLEPREFLSKQCSERSYLIYRLSQESRATAIQLAQSGGSFPDTVKASELLKSEGIWNEDVEEQYHRAVNCLHLSRTSLSLASPHPARDYQIIGRAAVHKLLLGRTACVLQTYMSRTLQASRHPYEWALANHRKAASLFDSELAPMGPEGPLEQPDVRSHNTELFKEWSEKRESAAKQHVRLIVHLASDMARHVLGREQGSAFLAAAEEILSSEIDEEKEKNYAKGVVRSTMKAL